MRPHTTIIAPGLIQNGQGVPAIGGKCHAAWRLFDTLTHYDDSGELHYPTRRQAIAEGVALGLNAGNLGTEYKPWCRFNGFASKPRADGFAHATKPQRSEAPPAIQRASSLGHQMTGNSGLFYVAWQLSRRGWQAVPTVRNARGADLHAANADETRVVTIQSKALSKKTDVPLGGSIDNLRSDWWMITINANTPEPTCYILTLDEVRASAGKNTNAKGAESWWLSRRLYALPQYENAWERLEAIVLPVSGIPGP